MKVVIQHAVGDPGWRPEVMRPAEVTRFAQLAEQYGYAALAFTDHPAPSVRWTQAGGEGSSDPFTSLAFCAAVTSTIRLMTFVLALPYHNPFRLAHQASTLDQLSAGRLDLGLGTGYMKRELYALGADLDQRRAQFDDVLDVAFRVWNEPEVNAEGRGWSARGVHGQPAPLQLPHPPLWIHGNSAFGRERAARHGAGWIGVLTTEELAGTMRTRPLPDLAAVELAVADLRARTARAGRDQADVRLGLGGLLPMLDIRRGWDVDEILQRAEQACGLGIETLFVTVIGDDAHAANDTVEAFGEQLVGNLDHVIC